MSRPGVTPSGMMPCPSCGDEMWTSWLDMLIGSQEGDEQVMIMGQLFPFDRCRGCGLSIVPPREECSVRYFREKVG